MDEHGTDLLFLDEFLLKTQLIEKGKSFIVWNKVVSQGYIL